MDILDPLGISSSLRRAFLSWLQDDAEFYRRLLGLYLDLQHALMEEVLRFLSGCKEESGKDLNEVLLGIVRNNAQSCRRYHVILTDWFRSLVAEAPGLERRERERAVFWMNQFARAFSPANLFWMNPAAVQKFMDSAGESIRKGFESWLEDSARGDYMLKITDGSAFRIGVNIATTPGHVVFRNDLMEIIQYCPSTPEVYSVPIVFIQPWINKFFIFDLSEKESFVRYLRDKGFTVFITSWKNPATELRHTTFDDYMLQGALKAVEVAMEICGTDKVHAAGYCIGGTALAALMAWMNAEPQGKSMPVLDWTLFSTLVDFSEPGEIGAFINEETIRIVEALMERDGYLDKNYIGMVFRLLGSESLIWRTYIHNYLCGGTPPKSPMLYWNSDGTRLPQSMCSFYLREFYMKNSLAAGNGLILGGRPIKLESIRQSLYAVGTRQDHICPWKGTFRTCSKTGGPARYVLSSEGHITGIVNPPSGTSRRKFWAGDTDGNCDPEEWLSAQQERGGSWWDDWAEWLIEKDSSLSKPPEAGGGTYPVLGNAPGVYVMEQ